MIAQRASNVEDSITMAITATAQRLKKEGLDVVSFGAGEPDFDTPDYIKEATIKALNEGKTKYTAATGIIELKQAICEKLKKEGNLTYTPENIVISCGAKHSIYNIMMSVVDPGDEVIIPSPYWVSYPDQVQLCGGKSVFIETNESSAFKITAQQLKNALTSKTKLVILNSPSNPTGSVYSKDELMALAEVLKGHGCLILSDEIYEKLIYDNVSFSSIASLSEEMFKRTIVVNGVAKSYSMTGFRIGYCAAPKEIAKAVGTIQSHSTSNPTTFCQWASLAAIQGDDSAINVMKTEFNKRRKEMVRLLNEIPNVKCITPDGAFYAFPNISACFGKKTPKGTLISNSDMFCKALLEEAYVACVPGSGFGAEGFIRLSYATSLSEIEKGISRIKQWISSLN